MSIGNKPRGESAEETFGVVTGKEKQVTKEEC